MFIRHDVCAQVLGTALGNTGRPAPMTSIWHDAALIATMRSVWSAL